MEHILVRRRRKRGFAHSIDGVRRVQPCLYAVSFVDLPGVVKIGRSADGWLRRKSGYKSAHGGVLACVNYALYPEYDLVALEADVIATIGLPVHEGVEWFCGGLVDAALAIERVLSAYDIPFAVEVRNGF